MHAVAQVDASRGPAADVMAASLLRWQVSGPWCSVWPNGISHRSIATPSASRFSAPHSPITSPRQGAFLLHRVATNSTTSISSHAHHAPRIPHTHHPAGWSWLEAMQADETGFLGGGAGRGACGGRGGRTWSKQAAALGLGSFSLRLSGPCRRPTASCAACEYKNLVAAAAARVRVSTCAVRATWCNRPPPTDAFCWPPGLARHPTKKGTHTSGGGAERGLRGERAERAERRGRRSPGRRLRQPLIRDTEPPTTAEPSQVGRGRASAWGRTPCVCECVWTGGRARAQDASPTLWPRRRTAWQPSCCSSPRGAAGRPRRACRTGGTLGAPGPLVHREERGGGGGGGFSEATKKRTRVLGSLWRGSQGAPPPA